MSPVRYRHFRRLTRVRSNMPRLNCLRGNSEREGPATMRRSYFSAFILVSLTIVCAFSAAAQTSKQYGGQEIAFTVSMPKPHTHLLEVQIHVRHGLAQRLSEEILVMPVWTPGSYLIREFERNVQDFTATDALGQPLLWEKIDKNRWRVKTNSSQDWRVT